jgi:hypothetical protein
LARSELRIASDDDYYNRELPCFPNWAGNN